MIPKKIHYCWLSGDPYPAKIKRCIDSWRKVMPDYEIRLWDKDSIDLDAAPAYVREACHKRKWAFAADYIRLYALYNEGGIYFDSDVLALKSFDPLLDNSFFSSLEYHPSQIERSGAMEMIDDEGNRIKDGYVSGIMIQAAVMGSVAGCPFVKDLLDWYADKRFVRDDGEMCVEAVAPQIYSVVAESHGFKYKDVDQDLGNGVMIYRSEIFAGNRHEVTDNSYAIHYCAHSWHPTVVEKLRKFFRR